MKENRASKTELCASFRDLANKVREEWTGQAKVKEKEKKNIAQNKRGIT